MILREIFKRLETFTSCAEFAWMFKEWKQSWNLLKSESFNIYKKATTSIILLLDHLKLDMEISDIGMKTTRSNKYREISRNNRNANGMLATIHKKARFSCKNRSVYFLSQSVDCIRWASCIWGSKSRRNQVEWYRSLDLYNY